MNIDLEAIKDGQRPIGNCSLGGMVWRKLYVNPNEAESVRHILISIRLMRQDYFERMLHELVKMGKEKN